VNSQQNFEIHTQPSNLIRDVKPKRVQGLVYFSLFKCLLLRLNLTAKIEYDIVMLLIAETMPMTILTMAGVWSV
jgi:hypothetical protein